MQLMNYSAARRLCKSVPLEAFAIDRGPLVIARLLSICLSLSLASMCSGQEEFIIELRNGMRLGPGVTSETDSISTNSFQQGGGGEVRNKPIGIMDDGLRLTFFNSSPRNLLAARPSTQPNFEQITLPSEEAVNRTGDPPSIFGVAGITNFNRFGRRIHSFITSRGRVDVLQGITLLTPEFAKVEILRAETDKFVWDQRIAISSIPADQLREILHQGLDLTKPTEWLRLYKFYLQAERYSEARDTIAEAIARFPADLDNGPRLLTQTEQLLANQKFEEIKRRQTAGQHQLATQLLLTFPQAVLPLETQVQLDDEIRSVQQQVSVISDVTEALKATAAKLPEPDQQLVAPLIQEISDEITFDTAVRLADFQRLRGDASIAAENLVSLALGGWILGPGTGVQNFAVTKSLLRVRNLIREYLDDAPEPRRAQILNQLQSEEGAQPQLVAKLINTMKPPQSLPPHDPEEAPGLFRLAVKQPGRENMEYVVQLPPEYDPNRKYPCVVALPGKGNLPESEINFWSGINVKTEEYEFRVGPATRYGYVVISPAWIPDSQPDYQYTEGEHSRVLSAFRDAQRRISIDTDRVFIAGHFEGATAAWDIAQSHPELWAGAVMISPGADKYIVHYHENIRASSKTPDQIPLATYIVYGDSDGTRQSSDLGNVGTRYLTTPAFDSTIVEYRGRGRERFQAELPRITEWMELSSHRRMRTPREINAVTMRPGDRFFYWLEAPQILPKAAGNPFQFDPTGKATFEASLLDSATNGVRISNMPSLNRDAWIWLTPDMVDFSRTITVILRGDRNRYDVSPDVGIMLEDVRMRADRLHFFWQRLIAPQS